MSRWDDLADEMNALDVALAVQLVGRTGRVIGIVGGDWTPPLTTDPQAHVDYLERVVTHAEDALKKAETLEDAAKQKVKRAAKKAVETAEDLAKDVASAPAVIASKAYSRAQAVEQKLKDTAKSLAPVYLGLGVVAWIAIGVGVWLYFDGKKVAA